MFCLTKSREEGDDIKSGRKLKVGNNFVPLISQPKHMLKDIYFVIFGIIIEFTDKGQLHYLTKLKGPQVGNYLYTTQFLLLR